MKFYLENQWKSMPNVVFLENHGFLAFLNKSNLFKGLFYGKCGNSHFPSLSCHFLVTFCQLLTSLGWFNEGPRTVFSVTEK